jgi:signal transduction histidine kinase
MTAVVTLLLWGAMVAEERRLERRAGDAVVEGLRDAVDGRVHANMAALRNLASFWARYGRQPLAQWEEDVEILIQEHPGLERVEWIHPRRRPRVAAADEDATVAVRGMDEERVGRAVDRAMFTRREVTVGPFRLPDGRHALHVAVPVPETEGVLSARMSIERLLEGSLSDRVVGHAIAVERDGARVLARDAGDADPDGWRRLPLGAPFGQTWQVAASPLRASGAAASPAIPGLVLTVGLVNAVLLGALLRVGQVAQARARRLSERNDDLRRSIEEVRRAEEEVRRLNQDLEARVAQRTETLAEAVADLEAFNHSVSHDLRSPLGAIMNISAILEEDHGHALGESGRRGLETIRRSTLSALSLMDGLLALSRVAREEVTTTEVSMTELARSVFEVLLAAGPRANVDLKLGELPVVRGDAAMMRIVLQNLLSNALKFTRGRPRPEIDVTARTEPDVLVFEVRDNGVGFDMRWHDKLFGMFERLHRRDEFEGSGMGLAIVHRIVRKHGGRVWAEGAVGQGACFSFSLPRRLGVDERAIA